MELFTLESNENYGLAPQPLSSEMRSVADHFGIPEPSAVARVEKKNPFSDLYRLSTPTGTFMLRATDPSGTAVVEAQSLVAANVAPPMIAPLRGEEGRFVWVSAERVWIAYPAIDGELYDGAELALGMILEVAGELLLAIDATTKRVLPDPSVLPRTPHRPRLWSAWFEILTQPDMLIRDHSNLARHVNDSTLEVLAQEREAVLDLVGIIAAETIDPSTTVHNDLNHSNILTNNGEARFLDIEDICFEDRGVAMSHAVFKLARHAVYRRHRSAREVGAELPSILASIGVRCDVPDTRALFRRGAFRIVSDIFEICAYTTEQGSDSQLYDLEKRIHNLFELAELTGTRLGSRTF